MVVFVDPNAPATDLPTKVTSPDGILTAWSRGSGVLLRAAFTNTGAKRTNLATDPNFTWVDGLTSGGGATKTVDTSWKVSGTSSVKITPSGTDSASAVYAVSSANHAGILNGHTYTVSATIRVNKAQTGTLNANARKIVVGYRDANGADQFNYAMSAAAANVAGTVTRLSVTATFPANMQYPYVRLMNGSANTADTVNWDALLIEEGTTTGSFFDGDTPSDGDYTYRWTGQAGHSASIADPSHALKKVRFIRDDGVRVRSGDDAWAPGGWAYAFDNEAHPGDHVLYQAFPVDKNGNLGTGSEQLSIQVPALPASKDCWLKSVEQPTLSMQLEMQIPDPEQDQDGRDTLTDIPGSEFQAGGWDVPVQAPWQFVFKTYTLDEYQALVALLKSGPLLWQGLNVYGIDDFYCLRKSVHVAYEKAAYDPRRLITVTLQPIDRPPTLDAPMAGSGKSYDWVAGQVESYDQLQQVWPTYPDIIESPL